MDLRQLRTLVAIAENGSFQDAADAVSLTPSAVSQQIRALESEVGSALFDRHTRPPALTTQGLQLLDAARSMLRTADDALQVIRGRRAPESLVLGAIRSSAFGLLPAALVPLRVRFPGLRISIRSARSDELMFDVLAGRLDAAVVPDHDRIPGALTWRAFLHEPLFAIAPPGTPALPAMALLAAHPFVRYKRNVPLAHLIDAEIARMGVLPDAAMEIDSMYGIVTCVAAGLGVSVVPYLALSSALGQQVVAVPFGAPQVQRRVGMVEREDNPRRDLVALLHDELAAQANRFGLPRDRREGEP